MTIKRPLISSLSVIFAVLISCGALAEDAQRRLFQPADIHRIKDVDNIAVSPDGEWVAYSVSTTNVDKDEDVSDLFMVNWDGSTRIQLTHTEDSSEGSPRFSPDGKYLAFITSRTDGKSEESDDPKSKSQVWLMNRSGGEAKRLTELPGGVSEFEWSPDSRRLVIVSMDPEEKAKKDEDKDGPSHDTPKPIVIDRYYFKEDVTGYLVNRYRRLYLVDLETAEVVPLTPGPYNSTEPAWGANGDLIAFTSKRQGDPDRNDNSDIYVIEAVEGATPRQLTSWDGPDSSPAFSPDGRHIAYLQGGSGKYTGYDPDQLAVISVQGGTPALPTSELDRYVSSPRWSFDGRKLHFVIEEDRVNSVVSMPFAGGKIKSLYPGKSSPGAVYSFSVGRKGIVAVASFAHRPAELYRTSDGYALSDHNKAFRESIEWASVEGFDSVSKDGTSIGSMLLKPPGFKQGVKYPTIAYIHGGPIGQDRYEFDATAQILAAQGYLVVNPNYRGSNGHGREFARAIYQDWGNLEIQDIHSVMDKMVEEGLSDPDSLGIGGWSYGGMNTNYAIATDTRFAAAVSGASESNMMAGYGTDMYIRQWENEVGLPWESIDTYLKVSYPFLQADRIKTPTMFMCGEKDFNVPLIHSEQMYQALRSLNVPTKLIIYPGQYHGLSKPSYKQDRLERMIDWYGQYLKAESE
jgi:dipeptidyl aminopeptidase/acylaminoacyl peptidase